MQTWEYSISEMAWLCHIPTEFQVHLTFFFLYRCNNRGTYQNKWFSNNSWGFKETPLPLFLMDNIKLGEIPRKIKQKVCDCFILHFKFCKCSLWNVTWYSYQSFYFLKFYIRKELHPPLSEKWFLTWVSLF